MSNVSIHDEENNNTKEKSTESENVSRSLLFSNIPKPKPFGLKFIEDSLPIVVDNDNEENNRSKLGTTRGTITGGFDGDSIVD